MTRTSLYVIGTSGLALEMAQLAAQIDREQDRWDFAGFIAASSDEIGRPVGRGVVVGDDEWLLSSRGRADLILAIGNPAVRAKAIARYVEKADRFGFPNLVHPSALVESGSVEIGRGNVITAGCIFTTEIVVGDFNLFNLHTTVGHEARIGNSCVVNPSVNISGWVTLGDRVLLGTGAQILERLAIGSDAKVGAGAVVTKPVDAGATVVGVPARPLTPPATA